jgi:hypothetical protein
MQQMELSKIVAVEREISGIEMGVLADGTPYLTLRGLAAVCGLAPSTMIEQVKAWNDGKRTSKLAQFLIGLGVKVDRLSATISENKHAVPDSVCILILEYYAHTGDNPGAKKNYRILARKGLRSYIYESTGYDEKVVLPRGLRDFSDRLLLNRVPAGYYSVFKEMADFLLKAIQGGLMIDEGTVPDISVGRTWSGYWEQNDLEVTFGARTKYEHNYPEYYSQSDSNPQPAWAYPIESLGIFRKWLEDEYIPERLPAYLATKVRQNKIASSVADKLLAAVTPMALRDDDAAQ